MQRYNKETTREPLDQDLVEKIQADSCNDSLEELCSRHAPLVVSMATRLSRKYNNWAITQEVIDDKVYIIYSAAQKFKKDRNTKFSTFLGNETKWAFLNKCNQLKKRSKHLSLMSDFLDCLRLVEEEDPHEEKLNQLLSILEDKKDKRMLRIFSLRYKIGKQNKVMPWHLVAKEVGLSAQGCINIHSSGITYLKDKLKREGLHA